MRGHRSLVAWQRAMELVTEVDRVTGTFPKHELYGLTAQIRRAAVSVPSNLAEGYGRNSRNEFHHFIGQARGPLAEVETQIETAKNPWLRQSWDVFRIARASRGSWAGADGVARLVRKRVTPSCQPIATSYL
jgi:four helix bundle protein